MSYPRRCLDCQCGFRCAAELYAHTVDSYFTFSRCFCIYLFCVFGRESPTLRFLPYRAVHLFTLCPVETMTGPSKELFSIVYSTCLSLYRMKNSFGGPFGHCPRVLDSFALKGLQLFKYLYRAASNLCLKVNKKPTEVGCCV